MSKVLCEFDKSAASVRELATSVRVQLGITVVKMSKGAFYTRNGGSRSTSAGDLEYGFPTCLVVSRGDNFSIGPSFE